MIIAVIYTTFTVGKRKPEKNSGLYGIRTFDLCDHGAAIAEVKGTNPVQAGIFFSGFLFTTAKVAYMRAHNMIFIYSKLH